MNTIFFHLFFAIVLFGELRAQYEHLHFHRSKETLSKIKALISTRQKGAYLRFGDGDLELAVGNSELFQKNNKQLQIEMQETLALNGPTLLKTLPLYCKELGGYELGMYPGNHEASYDWCLNILKKAEQFWKSEITDVYSHVALHFLATENSEECLRFLAFLKKSHCSVFVGNKNIPREIIDLLFGEKCTFIPTPSKNAYDEINRIEAEIIKAAFKNHEYQVIITAMGCSGRPLQKRLWHKLNNVFLFDFGSLMDALCGWNTRAWIELTKFNHGEFIKLLNSNL